MGTFSKVFLRRTHNHSKHVLAIPHPQALFARLAIHHQLAAGPPRTHCRDKDTMPLRNIALNAAAQVEKHLAMFMCVIATASNGAMQDVQADPNNEVLGFNRTREDFSEAGKQTAEAHEASIAQLTESSLKARAESTAIKKRQAEEVH
ncbi:hypothetical protein DIPPA_09245 [Diplonema papillatum]|nr:hypothetical protein DIPPA_09245 [Diplonema papillatum]